LSTQGPQLAEPSSVERVKIGKPGTSLPKQDPPRDTHWAWGKTNKPNGEAMGRPVSCGVG
jgi:hypothetical protein